MDSKKSFEVYTDGSYHDTADLRDKTYGAIYLVGADVSDWQFFTNSRIYTESRNVGGEILAAEFAISLITKMYDQQVSQGASVHYDINLFFDYEGVGKWLTGEWRAKKVLTQRYKSYVSKLLESRDIILYPHWVRGHGSVLGNNRADELATNAYKSERCYNANSFVEEVLK